VISATDDLHAMRPEMEESERSFRHAENCAGAVHGLALSSQFVLPDSALLNVAFERVGTVRNFVPQTLGIFSAPAAPGRAPPSVPSTSV